MGKDEQAAGVAARARAASIASERNLRAQSVIMPLHARAHLTESVCLCHLPHVPKTAVTGGYCDFLSPFRFIQCSLPRRPPVRQRCES